MRFPCFSLLRTFIIENPSFALVFVLLKASYIVCFVFSSSPFLHRNALKLNNAWQDVSLLCETHTALRQYEYSVLPYRMYALTRRANRGASSLALFPFSFIRSNAADIPVRKSYQGILSRFANIPNMITATLIRLVDMLPKSNTKTESFERAKSNCNSGTSNKWVNLLWVLRYSVAHSKGVIAISFAVMILGAIFQAQIPNNHANLINAILCDNSRLDSKAINRMLLKLIGYKIAVSFLNGLRGYLFITTGAQTLYGLRNILFSALINKDIGYYDFNSVGLITSYIGNDCKELAQVIPCQINPFTQDFVTLIVSFVYLFRINIKLAAVSLLAFLGAMVVSVLYASGSKHINKDIQTDKNASYNAAMHDLTLIRVIRTHNTENYQWRRYKDILKRILSKEIYDAKLYGLRVLATRLINMATPCVVLIFGYYLLGSYSVDKHVLTRYFMYMKAIMDLTDIWEYLVNIHESVSSSESILKLVRSHSESVEPQPNETVLASKSSRRSTTINLTNLISHAAAGKVGTAPDISSIGDNVDGVLEDGETVLCASESGGRYPKTIHDNIRYCNYVLGSTVHQHQDALKRANNDSPLISFCNVKFAYPINPDHTILNGLFLSIYPKQRVAVVGPSGSGKSTILRLILNLYKPTQGTIIINGRNIQSYDQSVLLSQISWVPQDNHLFPMSIADNIAYSMSPSTYTLQDVVAAAKQAFCHHFISELPNGYDTIVSERGGSLSGGQKQRIAIARALIRKPKVLLLDEVTSALDPLSERLVKKSVDDITKSMAVVIIAHRLSTIKNANIIYVLKDGKVVEAGNHDELARIKHGVYQRLLQKQIRIVR